MNQQKCIDNFDYYKDNLKTRERFSEGLSKASNIEFLKNIN
jgi:hypothetical protein